MRAAATAGHIISENKRLSYKFMKGENSFWWRRLFRSGLEMLEVRYLNLNTLVQHSRCELDLKSLYRTSKSQNRWGLHTMRFSLQEMMRIRSCLQLLLIVIMLHLFITWRKREMNFAVELSIQHHSDKNEELSLETQLVWPHLFLQDLTHKSTFRCCWLVSM